MINHSEWLTQCDNYGSEELRLSKVDFRQSEARPMSEKEKDNRHKKRNKSAQESKGLAVIPYVEGLSETAERILHKYGIQQQQQNLFQQYKYGYETLQDNETTASPPKRPTHSRANWRMSVQDSMP